MVVVGKKLLQIAVGLTVFHFAAEAKSFKNVKVRRHLKVGHKAKFKGDVKIKKNLEVEGSVSFGQEGVPFDLNITGNIILPANSATVGNIRLGSNSLFNFVGVNNAFLGITAGNFTNTGSSNTGVGANALVADTSGAQDTAFGANALASNTTGSNNTAVGSTALQNNTIGSDNSAFGPRALNQMVSGLGNTAIGSGAMLNSVAGELNTVIGFRALENATGDNNIAIGTLAGVGIVTGNENIIIGHPGFNGETGVIRIGLSGSQDKTFISGIRNVTTGINDGIAVLVDSQGQLGTVSSTKKVKENIRDIGYISSLLLKLRPVSFNYIADEGKVQQYGLIAEEVAEIYPELVVFDEEGKPYTVKYHLLYALMLNEIQRCHRIIADHENAFAIIDEKMEAAVTQYVSQLQTLFARIAALEQAQNSSVLGVNS